MIVTFLDWWSERRLHLRDLPRGVRSLVWVAVGVASLSSLLIVAVGLGWEPWGGTQFAAFGGEPPRLAVPWACAALGVLTYGLVVSTTMPGWRHPAPVRIAVAVGGAALAAQGITMGWVVAGADVHAGLAVPLGWIGVSAAVTLAVARQGYAERRPHLVASLGAVPLIATLAVWATIGSEVVRLPDGTSATARDVYAQGTITFIGAIAAAAGILLLWSLVMSTRQARDIGEGVADLQARVPTLLVALLVAKGIWLVSAYTGSAFGGTVVSSVDDGWTAWIVGIGLVAAAFRWLAGRGAGTPTDYENRESLRVIGFGYAGGPLAAVVVGLAAAIAGVLWTLEPSSRLNDLLGWLIGSDPPVALWVVVGVTVLTVVGAFVLRRRGSVGWVAAAVVGIWAAPRAIELAARIVEVAEPLQAPSRVTVDTIVTAAVAVGAVAARRLRSIGVETGDLVLVLVASTLIAHPLGIMPAGWQDGWAFYVLLVYPLAYTFLLDSVWLNGLDRSMRPGRVLRTVSVTALLVVATSLLVLFERVGPGFETAEAALLGAIGEAYLLYPAALLAVAAAMRRRRTGEHEGALGTQSTSRWLWSSATARVGRSRP